MMQEIKLSTVTFFLLSALNEKSIACLAQSTIWRCGLVYKSTVTCLKRRKDTLITSLNKYFKIIIIIITSLSQALNTNKFMSKVY